MGLDGSMSKKDELVPLPPYISSPPVVAMTRPGKDTAIVKRERAVQDEMYIQQLVARFQEMKSDLTDYHISRIMAHTTVTFTETWRIIYDVTEPTGYSAEYDHYVKEFQKRQVQTLSRTLERAQSIAVENIIAELQRALYQMPEPEKKSFLQRLFGG